MTWTRTPPRGLESSLVGEETKRSEVVLTTSFPQTGDGPSVKGQSVVDGTNGILLISSVRPAPETQTLRLRFVVERVEVEVPGRRRQTQGPRPRRDKPSPTLGAVPTRAGSVEVVVAQVEGAEVGTGEVLVTRLDGSLGVMLERVDDFPVPSTPRSVG